MTGDSGTSKEQRSGPMRVIFMGSPDFAVPALDALHEGDHEIAAVYTQPPRPAGRGKAPREVPVAERARELGLELRQPTSLKGADEQAAFEALGADAAVVAAYGLILPPPVLAAPRHGCLNIHASLLPRWRGAAPIHRAIMAGDAETGISIMQMEAGLDTGPVLLQEATPIGPEETTAELHDRLAEMGARLITEALDRLPELTARPQPEEGVTYAHKISKDEAWIDWSRPAAEVARKIRGLSPFPGAKARMGDEVIKLLGARAVPGSGAPGQVLGGFIMACGDGAVEITRAQRAGRKPMPAEAFLRGVTLPERLEGAPEAEPGGRAG